MNDLPDGYRWATPVELDWLGRRDWPEPCRVIQRTVDAAGVPYTQDEADVAVPIGWRAS